MIQIGKHIEKVLRHGLSLSALCREVKLVTTLIGSLGNSCYAIIVMMKGLDLPEALQSHLMFKIMNIAICSTYSIFCCQNRFDGLLIMFSSSFLFFCFINFLLLKHCLPMLRVSC